MIECRKESLQMPAMGQDPVNKASAGSDYLAGYQDKADQEAFEFHPQDVAPLCWNYRCQAIPSLKVPCQARNNHVGPVRNETIGRHSQCINPAL